ncbi:MAG: helix-turn-helix transcriptional regulator [Cyclonatronaceae bacterium]
MNNSLRIIRPSELARIMGISSVTLWRREKAGKLPKRRKIGSRAVGWLSSDVEAHLKELPDAEPAK